ncbi:hypothetical protein BDQ17DRAFT_450109 [Cyathus striatus]|nr:hypothetical protein BDQ17DRAFT_450109 [Cyathus striatus]
MNTSVAFDSVSFMWWVILLSISCSLRATDLGLVLWISLDSSSGKHAGLFCAVYGLPIWPGVLRYTGKPAGLSRAVYGLPIWPGVLRHTVGWYLLRSLWAV